RALAEIRAGGDQRVVNIVRTRRAVAGDAFLRRHAFESGGIGLRIPVRRHEDVAGARVVPARGVEGQRAGDAGPGEDRGGLSGAPMPFSCAVPSGSLSQRIVTSGFRSSMHSFRYASITR